MECAAYEVWIPLRETWWCRLTHFLSLDLCPGEWGSRASTGFSFLEAKINPRLASTCISNNPPGLEDGSVGKSTAERT